MQWRQRATWQPPGAPQEDILPAGLGSSGRKFQSPRYQEFILQGNCCGMNACALPKFMYRVLTPHVAILGARASEEIIKLSKVMRAGPIPCPPREKRHQRVGFLPCLPVHTPGAGRVPDHRETRWPCEPGTRCSPDAVPWALISGVWPPELRESTFLLLEPLLGAPKALQTPRSAWRRGNQC